MVLDQGPVVETSKTPQLVEVDSTRFRGMWPMGKYVIISSYGTTLPVA